MWVRYVCYFFLPKLLIATTSNNCWAVFGFFFFFPFFKAQVRIDIYHHRRLHFRIKDFHVEDGLYDDGNIFAIVTRQLTFFLACCNILNFDLASSIAGTCGTNDNVRHM